METGSVTVYDLLAFGFSAAAYVPYVRGILKRTTLPTMSSWISWLIMDTAILVAALAKHELPYQLTAYIVGCVVVIGTNLYVKASLGWTKLDSFCVGLVILAAVLWSQSGDPNVAIVLSLTAMFVGSISMCINDWADPHRESSLAWLCNLGGAIFGVCAIKNWTIAGALSPVFFLTLSIVFNIVIQRQWFDARPNRFSNIPLFKLLDRLLMR